MSQTGELLEVLFQDDALFWMAWERQKAWCVVGNGCDTLEKEALIQYGVQGLSQIVSPEDKTLAENFITILTRAMAGNLENVPMQKHHMEVVLRLRNSLQQYSYYKVVAYYRMAEDGGMTGILLEVQALSEQDKYLQSIAKVVTDDTQPVYFTDGALKLIRSHPDWKFALVQFDIARFKIINIQHGEEMGDELLRYILETLKSFCHRYQLFARLSADVFMILMPYGTREDIDLFIRELDKRLTAYPKMDYRIVYGVSLVETPVQNLRKYGDQAALARLANKKDAVHKVKYYDASMEENASLRKFVEDNMERALADREFKLYLQPKFSISANKIIGAEALVRWKHPQRGMMYPDQFIHVFEDNNFIVKLDYYMWEEVCRLLHGWSLQGKELIPVSVNVSRRHLNNDEFIHVLETLVDKYQVERRYLEIEITESINDGKVMEVEKLKELGYTLLMDDFGSGYSTLNLLKDTMFDVIKIDRIFLQNFMESVRGKKIVEKIIEMTNEIGLDLVAEGVETLEQAEFLCHCGCDTAQGYYYEKPISEEDFVEKYVQ